MERQPGGSTLVKREYSTSSGDWLVKLSYHYTPAGRLDAMTSDFTTFNGISASAEKASLTRCVRTYTASESGALRQTSEKITDGKTGKKVTRQFWEPKIEPWLSSKELPLKPLKTANP